MIVSTALILFGLTASNAFAGTVVIDTGDRLNACQMKALFQEARTLGIYQPNNDITLTLQNIRSLYYDNRKRYVHHLDMTLISGNTSSENHKGQQITDGSDAEGCNIENIPFLVGRYTDSTHASKRSKCLYKIGRPPLCNEDLPYFIERKGLESFARLEPQNLELDNFFSMQALELLEEANPRRFDWSSEEPRKGNLEIYPAEDIYNGRKVIIANWTDETPHVYTVFFEAEYPNRFLYVHQRLYSKK